MAGAVYIPPNPLNSAMDTYDHLTSIMQGNQLDAQGNTLDAKRQAALEKFAKLWFGKSQNAAVSGTPDPNQAPGDSSGYSQTDM